MIDKLAGIPTQIRQLEKKLKDMDASKIKPALIKEITDTIQNLKNLLKEKMDKREERRKAKEEAAKTPEAPKPEVEKEAVVEPVVAAIPTEAAPKCAICGVEFKSQPEYRQHKEDAHGHRDYVPMDPTQKKEVVKNVEHKLGPAIIGSEEPKAELYKTGLKIDDKVEPVRGAAGSVGIVLREPGINGDPLVYIKWVDGPMKLKDEMGGYYPSDVRLIEASKPVEAADEKPKGEPPHNPGPEHICPECKDWHEKHADLRSNYDALLKDLKDERQEAYDKSDHVWVTRLDQKIQDMEKAIAEKFPSEKQSAQVAHHDPMGHGLGDLYILPNSPEEAQKIIKFVEDSGRTYTWSTANVEGHKWYGKRFIEVPFGMDIEKDMREHFANTPFYAKPVEEIMAKKEAGAENAEQLTIMDHTPPRANSGPDKGGKDGFDEFQDEWAMPAGTEKEGKISPEERAAEAQVGKMVKQVLTQKFGFPVKVSTIPSQRPNTWIQAWSPMGADGKYVSIPNDFRAEVAKIIGATSVLDWNNVNWGNIRENGISLTVSQWKKVLETMGLLPPIGEGSTMPIAPNASLKTALKINVFNKTWEATPVVKEGKLSYEISDGKNKVLSISPLNGKEMNAEQLKWVAERELQKGYKKGILKENIAFLKAGSKVLIISTDKTKGQVKFASLEAGVRGWCKASSIEIEALESQAVRHGEHSDKVLGQTGTETLLDCVEGGPIWVNSTELLDANRPPATPESLNPIEEEAAKETRKCNMCHKEFDASRTNALRCPECYDKKEASEKGKKPSSLVHKEEDNATRLQEEMDYEDEFESLKKKESVKDCPDCHGTFTGKENEKCPTCGRFSVNKEAGHPVPEKGEGCAWCDKPFIHRRVETPLGWMHPECKREEEKVHSDKEALKTALPPVIPNQRGYLDNPPPVEKKAEVVDAEELDLYANNTSEIYGDKLEIIDTIKKMLANNTYDRRTILSLWEDWFGKAAQRYVKEISGSNIAPVAIQQAAREIEPYELERVKNGEYDSEAEQSLKNIPVMDVEQEKDKLIDQLRVETDPEKKKSLERRYKHLTMASLRKSAKADDTCRHCKKEHVPTYLGVCDSCTDAMYARDYSDKESALEKDAIIVHQDGKWCVKSPKNKNWSGGCYDSRAAAEKRLKTVEMFKHMKGTKVRPFSKKAEVMTDPYQALTDHISDMRTRMEQVQQRLESNPLPKQADAEIIKDEQTVPSIIEDLELGIDLLETRLHEEDNKDEDVHESLEEMENLLWSVEDKVGIPHALPEHENEPIHEEYIEERGIEGEEPKEDKKEKCCEKPAFMIGDHKCLRCGNESNKSKKEAQSSGTVTTTVTSPGAATTPTTTTTPATVPDDKKTSCALCGGLMFNSYDAYQQHMQYQHASDTMPTSPSQKNLPTIAASKKEADFSLKKWQREQAQGKTDRCPNCNEPVIRYEDGSGYCGKCNEPVHKKADVITDETITTNDPNAVIPDPNAPAAPVIQNVQPTDDDNLEIPVAAPTSPAPQGQKWVYNPDVMAYVLMPDQANLGKQI